MRAARLEAIDVSASYARLGEVESAAAAELIDRRQWTEVALGRLPQIGRLDTRRLR